ncbi:hypothetical protein B0H21DRAFT_551431 [Amylocystis lapponica]|nr:hypothetical protein B0H21DRAFT_551431 [Amylocystis lapponica]
MNLGETAAPRSASWLHGGPELTVEQLGVHMCPLLQKVCGSVVQIFLFLPRFPQCRHHPSWCPWKPRLYRQSHRRGPAHVPSHSGEAEPSQHPAAKPVCLFARSAYAHYPGGNSGRWSRCIQPAEHAGEMRSAARSPWPRRSATSLPTSSTTAPSPSRARAPRHAPSRAGSSSCDDTSGSLAAQRPCPDSEDTRREHEGKDIEEGEFAHGAPLGPWAK